MPDLRKGQYKRIGRIAENNPERAERVAERMDKRASRTERGAEIAANVEEKRTGGRDIARKDFARGVARMYEEENPRERQQAVRRYSTQAEEHRPNAAHEQARKRDTPLSMTPEPMSQMRGKLYESKKDDAKAKAVSIMRGKGIPGEEGGTQGTIKRLMGN